MIEWRDIVGYEGLYQVSSDGQVRSLDRVVKHGRFDKTLKGCLLHQFNNGTGNYLGVCLSKMGEARKTDVHVIVASAFLGKRPEGLDILHGVLGNRNNSVSNLRYGTKSENQHDRYRDGTHRGLAVRRSDGVIFQSMRQAARQTGRECSQSGIRRCCQGVQAVCGGFRWELI